MKNEKQEQNKNFYKGYKIEKFNNNFYIFDEYNINVDFTLTQEQAKQKIDNIIKEQEQKQKVFESLKELNKNTKKAKELYNNYTRAKAKELYNCYEIYSQAKQNAFSYCLKYFYLLDGVNRFIPTYNKNVFTFAFCFGYKDKKYICYITPTNNYKIEL